MVPYPSCNCPVSRFSVSTCRTRSSRPSPLTSWLLAMSLLPLPRMATAAPARLTVAASTVVASKSAVDKNRHGHHTIRAKVDGCSGSSPGLMSIANSYAFTAIVTCPVAVPPLPSLISIGERVLPREILHWACTSRHIRVQCHTYRWPLSPICVTVNGSPSASRSFSNTIDRDRHTQVCLTRMGRPPEVD